ncbi:MAG: sigma-70 family RNA polymerase sigma factor [bacterium]|nr:sigma-70 family RNA polymerase sigma factor [bacterium]
MIKDSTDEELVIEAQNGSVPAFTELVRRHQKAVKKDLSYSFGLAGEADDTAQEAFLKAYQKLHLLKPPYNFRAWVQKIAANMARNQMIRGPRFVSIEQSEAFEMAAPAEDDGESDLSARLGPVLQALAGLSAPLRETTRLFYLNRFSQTQIAQRLDVPLGTVKRRLWDSRLQIRKEIKMNGKGRTAEVLRAAPKILIRDLPGEILEIKAKGPGLYFGSVLEEGRSETCAFFDYPGGIPTSTVQTKVVRKVEMLGRQCYEVLVEHSNCEPPESNDLNYFEAAGKDFRWLMSIVADGSYPGGQVFKGERGDLSQDIQNRRERRLCGPGSGSDGGRSKIRQVPGRVLVVAGRHAGRKYLYCGRAGGAAPAIRRPPGQTIAQL